ncbi:MAG TPA: DUF4253 domain-containing protein, partial [Longimicrobium sp.]|nr:DUF4253 domain-containing protein [Longimicrobium sp.]
LLVYSVAWIDTSRRTGASWPRTLLPLAGLLATFAYLDRITHPAVWQVLMLGFLTVQWWLAPLMVWRTGRLPRQGTVEPYDAERHRWSTPLAEGVERAADALRREGCTPLGSFVWAGPDGGGGALATYLEDRDGTLAIVQGWEARPLRAGGPARPTVDVRVASALADGRRLITTDGRDAAQYVPPTVTVEHFPSLRGHPARLLDAHRRLRALRYGHAAVASLVQDGIEEAIRGMERRNAEQQVAGRRQRDLGEQLGFTLRGAFIGAWSLIFPLRQVHRWLDARRERALARELGIALPRAARPERDPLVLQGASAMAVAAVIALAGKLPAPEPAADEASRLVQAMMAPSTPGGRAPERLPAGFAVPADFAGAVRALERLTGGRAHPLEFEDLETMEMVPAEGFEIGLSEKLPDRVMDAAAPLFRARGFLLFRNQHPVRLGEHPEYIALYPRDAAYEVMALAQTNGANYGIGPDSVVAWLRRLEADHPFVVTGIGHDYFEGRFTGAMDDARARLLARMMDDFCPDVVTQGTGTLRALEREVRRERVLYCWWD